MCGRFNRTSYSISCSKYGEELNLLILSYNLSCANCTDGHKNWLKFAVAGFVLTFFYLPVVLFNINVTSSRLLGIIIYSQVLLHLPLFVQYSLLLMISHSLKIFY